MTRLLEQRSQLVGILLVASVCLCFQLTDASDDVFFINTTTNLCLNGENYVPSGVSASIVTNNSAVLHWDSIIHNPIEARDVRGYEVLYWPVSSTRYEMVSVDDVNDETVTIRNLRPYTRYHVAVRLYCSQSRQSLASPPVSFITEAVEPSVAVTNVSAHLTGDLEATISWNRLRAEDWNGIPYGYYVYVFVYSQDSMCGGIPMDVMTFPTLRNHTSIQIPLDERCYRVNVFPINHKAWGPESDPLYFTFSKLPLELKLLSADEVPQPTSAPPTPFLESPYVYILVVGVLAVVPVVIGIVLCKKAREKKSKMAQYCQGIHTATLGDIQMYPQSPSSDTSARLSSHPANSRIQAFSPLSNLSPMTPSRPLLSSPMPPLGSEHPRDLPSHFAMPPMPPVHSPTTPKFPQGISLGGNGGGPPFPARTFTLDSATASDVFQGSGTATLPPSGPGHHRPRANTEGGAMHMPNPYEYPVHPGGASTLPRTDNRSNDQSGGGIPPPPCHAPPPLTQSSLDIFARHGDKNGHQNLPRSAGGERQQQGLSHRSFSTTNAGGLSSPTSSAPSNSMRTIQSASHLHPVDEASGPDYATVEPLDNSLPRGKSSTLDRYPPPPHHHHHQHMPNGSTRGMRNSDDLSSFSEMTDNDSVQFSSGHGHIPAPYYTPREPDTGVYQVAEQRESVFSETSTEEPSISSGSIRGTSPSGAPAWSDRADNKKRLSSSSITPTNSRSSHAQLYRPPTSPS